MEKEEKTEVIEEKKEKKGVAVRIIVIVIILLAIIGLIYLAIPSPEKVVNNAFSDLKNGDFENIEQYINYDELVEDTGMNTDSEEQMSQEEIDRERLLYEDLEWRIKSVQSEGDTATVEVETTNKDYRTIFNNYFQTLIQKVFSNEDLSDEQIEEAFVQELQKDDVERVTTTQTITLTKQDGKWRITVDDSLKNAIYPGLEDAINSINPKLVIVIDALASRSIERISSTVQLSDTGIVPGAGVGNTRSEISQNSLGVPVVAIGIPTVVETAVLVNDSLDLFITKLQDEAKSNDYLNKLKEEDNYEEIKEALVPNDYNLIVTPKEIDELIENMTQIVASGINLSV